MGLEVWKAAWMEGVREGWGVAREGWGGSLGTWRDGGWLGGLGNRSMAGDAQMGRRTDRGKAGLQDG